ncbi:MAG TPA: carboxypeptidase-like regulatory domain-containing protein [Armatimonadota bacterium]|nr:carboxypeptidase-like regulatory domain-containing protein [Armatimonadota bacterium]
MRLLLALTALLALFPVYAVPVSGIVTGPDGKLVVNARVILTDTILGGEQALRTNNTGAFAADVTFDATEKYSWRITVFAPGCALYGGALNPGENSIQLQNAGTFTGQVVDENGKPVAGAAVTPRYVMATPQQESRHIWIPDTLKDTFTVKTDTEGIFTLPNLPMEGQAYLELSDPRFVRVNARMAYGKDIPKNPPLQARPGATLLGKAYYEDGKPASGIKVSANIIDHQYSNGGYFAEAITTADGSFQLTGLATGTFCVGLRCSLQDWTADALTGITATEGMETKIKNLRLIHGSVIKVTAVNADNGKPIPGVLVNAMKMPTADREAAWGRTDDAGQCTLRVPPGKYQVVINGEVKGYCIPIDGIHVEVTAIGPEPMTVPFTLSKGLSLSGIVRDETGKPVANVPLEVNVLCGKCGDEGCWHDQTSTGETKEDGTFTISGLTAGKARIFPYQYGVLSDWDIVTGAPVLLPTAGPIHITVRKVNYQTLTGHTVTPDGTPLSGVEVIVDIYTPLGSERGTGGSSKNISDTTGQLTFEHLRPISTLSFKTATKAGYQFISGGTITNQDGRFQMQDVVLSPLGSKISGVVVDSAGKPITGAKVISPGVEGVAVTDAQGRFTLDKLPAGEVSVLTVKGRAAARLRAVTDKGDVTLTLVEPISPKPKDIDRASNILERIWEESKDKDYYARENLASMMACIHPERNDNEQNHPSTDTGIMAVIDEAVKRDPAHVEELLPKIDQIHTSFFKMQALSIIAFAAVETQPNLAYYLYNRIKGLTGDGWVERVFGNMALIRLSIKLNTGEADSLYTEMMAVVEKHRAEENGLGEAVAEALVDVSPELARKAADALPVEERTWAYCRMTQAIAKKDIKLGLELLNELAGMPDRNGGSAFGVAAKSVISNIGKDDPAGALALARKVQGEKRPAALALAAQFVTRDDALALLREAVQTASSVSEKARYAAQAYVLDQAVGREFFANAQKMLAQPDTDGNREVAEFAFLSSSFDPAKSRVLLEQEFARRKQKQNDGWSSVSLVLAMTSIDVERALEMAQQLPEGNARFDAQRKIAQYLLATDDVRHTLAFDRWCGSDTWTPGEETGW